ncbi:MAG: HAD-IC family P-type ATPase, partial [Candidatus Paceibacteria bacterium]
AYIKITGDSSETITAIKKKFARAYAGRVIDELTFSSSRQFGAVHIADELGERVVLAGAPDIFLPYLRTAADREWVQGYIDTEAKAGKRLVCFVRSDAAALPQSLEGVVLAALSIVVINDNLRDGVIETVRFFQARGVVIRIISGDNPETVRSVALAAGVLNTQALITGRELEEWTEADFLAKARTYTIFARIKPEQKEQIIEALKQDGFTAMIGDGANDALAIKKADLGVAMFDGAPATRQIASVVLIKDSFVDLPNGVRLADSVIQNIEICASIFFNEVFLGFFFFVLVTAFGYTFPFTPLNIAFLTYFTIGLPSALIFYWVVRPVHEHVVKPNDSFLKRVLPYALVSAIPQALITAFAFADSLEDVRAHTPSSIVVLSFIVIGIMFFLFAPSVYSGPTLQLQKRQFYLFVLVEVLSVVLLINIPFVASFYNLTVPSVRSVIDLVPFISTYALIQYGLARYFSKQQRGS